MLNLASNIRSTYIFDEYSNYCIAKLGMPILLVAYI